MPTVAVVARWHPAAWVVAQVLVTALPLAAPEAIAEVSISLVYAALLLPFAIAIAYGAWLSAVGPTLLERIALPWHALAWLLGAGAALIFTAWATVNGPPVRAESAGVVAGWIAVFLLPAFATLVLGAYACSRRFRRARTGGGAASAMFSVTWLGALLVLAAPYVIFVIVITFTAMASQAA